MLLIVWIYPHFPLSASKMRFKYVENYVDNLYFFGFIHNYQRWKTYQPFIHTENLWINVENSVLCIYIG